MVWTPIKLRKGGDVTFVGEAEGPGGGSQPVKVVRVPVAFDTPGISTRAGASLYTALPGEILIALTVSVTTAWEGSGPNGYLGEQGVDPYDTANYQESSPMDEVDAAIPNLSGVSTSTAYEPTIDASVRFPVATPLIFAVLEAGDGSDPNSTTGEAEVVLVLLAAS